MQKITTPQKVLIQGLFLVLFAVLMADVALADPEDDARAAYLRKDYAAALKIVESPAIKGEAWAQHNLGVMYVNGQGMVKDDTEAVKWFRLAAQQGSMKAQNNLGSMYSQGQGVVQDYVKAHSWYNLSAVSGHAIAIENRDRVAKLMTPQQVADAQKLARDCQARQFKGCD